MESYVLANIFSVIGRWVRVRHPNITCAVCRRRSHASNARCGPLGLQWLSPLSAYTFSRQTPPFHLTARNGTNLCLKSSSCANCLNSAELSGTLSLTSSISGKLTFQAVDHFFGTFRCQSIHFEIAGQIACCQQIVLSSQSENIDSHALPRARGGGVRSTAAKIPSESLPGVRRRLRRLRRHV